MWDSTLTQAVVCCKFYQPAPESRRLEDVGDGGVGGGLVAAVGGQLLAQEGGQILVRDDVLQRSDVQPPRGLIVLNLN